MDKISLYDWQEEIVERMANEPTKAILVGSEQDQGKTATVLEFALKMGFKRVLFVGIRDTWQQFHERSMAQSHGAQPIRQINSKKDGKDALADMEWGADGWYFIGHQLLVSRDWASGANPDGTKYRKRLRTWDNLHFDLIVVDEVHVMAAYQNAGQKTLHALKSDWKIAMSGTFYGNKFVNAWAPSYWLWPDVVDVSFWRWKEKRVQTEPLLNRGGGPMLTPRGQGLKMQGLPVPERERLSVDKGEIPPEGRFVASLPCYIRTTGDPVPKPEVLLVDHLPEQRRMYEALEADALVWIRQRAFVVDLPVTLRERLRTASLGTFDFELVPDKKKLGAFKQEIFFPEDSRSTKIDRLLVKLAEFPNDRVVIGTHSKRFAKLVVKRMTEAGLNAVEWSGDVSATGRQAIKEAWLADEIQYIVCVIKSFSTGLDWAQTNCWRMGVLSEQEGDPTAMGQWVRRVFRTGPNKDKFEWFTIQCRNSYDEGIFNNLELQSAVQAATLNTTEEVA